MPDDEIVFYGLSTCMWCKKTKKLLEEMGLEFRPIWVNEVPDDERERIRMELKELNPNRSYPTVRFGDAVIVGYKPEELEEAAKAWRAKKK